MTFAGAMDRVSLGDRAALPRALRTLAESADADREDAAQHLWDVFTRLPKVVPTSVPDADRCEEEGITRWELFPRGMDSEWAYAALSDGAPDGTIVLEQTPDGWRFAENSVAGAEALAKSLSAIPPRPREAVRGEAFVRAVGPAFTRSPWWAWLTAALGLAAGCFAAWWAGRGLNAAANWLSKDDAGALHKLGGDVVGPLLRALSVPIGITLVVAGLLAGTAPLALTPTLENGRWAIAELLLVLAGGWLLVGLIELAILGRAADLRRRRGSVRPDERHRPPSHRAAGRGDRAGAVRGAEPVSMEYHRGAGRRRTSGTGTEPRGQGRGREPVRRGR